MANSMRNQKVILSDDNPFINSIELTLRHKAVSSAGTRVVRRIAEHIKGNRRSPLHNHLRILGAFIGDLLWAASFDPPRTCYRVMTAGSFTGRAIRYRAFKAVCDNLKRDRYIRIVRGQWGSKEVQGVASRFHPTPKLLDDLAAAGINHANFNDHFRPDMDIPLVFDAVRLREGSIWRSRQKIIGNRMKVDRNDPAVAKLRAEVTAINRFLEGQAFEGMTFEGLYRGFNMGDSKDFQWNKGGRLYAVGGSYQSMPRNKRPAIRINGEPVVEVDIGASHLSIIHGLEGLPLPGNGDPYDTGELNRDGVKRFVTMALGKGKIPSRWPTDSIEDYREDFDGEPEPGLTGDLEIDYPFYTVREVALRYIPLLNRLEELPYDWADLQYIESRVLISAMNELMAKGIVTLPLHDSLICIKSDSLNVSKGIQKAFRDIVDIECIIKEK